MNSPSLPAWSLRTRLLAGILLPILLCISWNTWVVYHEALGALHTAYDRTLLASAKTIGEQLDVQGYEAHATISATVPYSALEAFEADTQTRMFYRVSTLSGEMVSGFPDLPLWQGQLPQQPPYAALVDFYDSEYRDRPVRMAVLLQPVASATGRSMAIIQVAETLQLRENLALELLGQTLWQHAVLLILVTLTVLLVVHRVTRSVRVVGEAMGQRPQGDLRPVPLHTVPRELRPLLDGTNRIMERLRGLLHDQKRFVRDASHQLRTPLAVLKVQVQSARRGDVPPMLALEEIEGTVDRATELANQMLALAKVEQLREQPRECLAWDAVVREVSLDLAPLIADKDLDFVLEADTPVMVQAHAWMLRELVRNLLHNAVRHAPAHSSLLIKLSLNAQQQAQLYIADEGPGLSKALQEHLYQPFVSHGEHQGFGLGLALCHAIVHALGGTLELRNRSAAGLEVLACLPQASPDMV